MKDELAQVKNQFYVGAYQAAISTAISMPAGKSELDNVLRQVILYRSYLAHKKNSLVVNELASQGQNIALELKAVRFQAQYGMATTASQRAQVLADFKTLFATPIPDHPLAHLLLAEVLATEAKYDEAMTVISPFISKDMECEAFIIQLLLKVNRVDLAQSRLESLKSISEDAPLVQLAEAWVCIASGSAKYQDAFYIFQELLETFGVTSKLLNGQAVCQMGMGKFEDAEKLLLDGLNKSGDDPEILANLAACETHLQKPKDLVTRYLSQLEHASPEHILVKDLQNKSSAFDRAAQAFSQIAGK